MTDEQKTPSAGDGEPRSWERETLNKVLFATLQEQRRTRRWGIFFKLLFFVYLLSLLLIYLPEDLFSGSIALGKHTALVEVEGVIADNSNASADHVITGLRAAFKDTNTAGIILRINSPGGSPVQAGYINDEIVRLRAKYPKVPLYAVITDVCASGGYYVAAAADKIYADKASIVGSIGVLMDGFGFVGTMEKLGVERRLLAAGDHKGFLDPFSPVKTEDVAHVEGMLKDIHRQFIATVKKGRGTRLKESDTLYSGLVWTGEQSVEMGLVDALGSSSYVAREVIGAENIVNFTPRTNYLDRFAERTGLALGKAVLSSASAWGGLK